MPQEFRHTLHALNAERPFANWAAMGLGLIGLVLWAVWAVFAQLPQRTLAADVSLQGDEMTARFDHWTGPIPETALVIFGPNEVEARTFSGLTRDHILQLHIAFAVKPQDDVPRVALKLPPQSPMQLIFASLGMPG